MFSSDIVTSDPFLEMPTECQALYFHLGIQADDDGFVAPKKVVRMVGAQDDSLKLLIAKRFLIPFESGVIVIRHWREHNTIRMDRYQPTAYLHEKRTLVLDGGTYDVVEHGNQLATNGRVSKEVSNKERKDVLLKENTGDDLNREQRMARLAATKQALQKKLIL